LYHSPLRQAPLRVPTWPDPAVVYVTLAETKIGIGVISCGYAKDVDVQQSFVEEVLENQFRVRMGISKVQPYQPWYKPPTFVFATNGRVGPLTGHPHYMHREEALDTPVFEDIGYDLEDTPEPDKLPVLKACTQWP
jgi:hypothetical protein